MRINKFVAQATGLSRRAVDAAIQQGRVAINQRLAGLGELVGDQDQVMLDGHKLAKSARPVTIMLNKPRGYVSSRQGQGSHTIYELLKPAYHELKPVGRLDKDSSGLLLLTNDGDLANQLTHPSHAKIKIYEVRLNKPLQPLHQQMISDHGIQLEDGASKLLLQKAAQAGNAWQVTMSEGRNRQIRRTFAALGYKITRLHRTQFGPYKLNDLKEAGYKSIS